MCKLKVVDKITLNGKEVEVYLCDRKAKCKNSIFCGNECKRTFDKKHAVKEDITGGENK